MCGGHGPDQAVVWLSCGQVERAVVGGKGASLSTLLSLGAPVPPAFAVTTHAYQEVACALGLPRRASDVADADLPALRETIAEGCLPPSLRDQVETAFLACQELAGGPCAVAVRSSATAEDSTEFSFAGLHDSVLDVRDMDGLERAILRCWASLWSDRAVAYRRAGGMATDDAAIAVVVQQLVRSDVSFVVFTADPVNGHHGHLVISATWGLGEAVVSGLVVPDHIVIGPDGNVVEYVVGGKHLMVIPGGSPGAGVREVPVPRALRGMRTLSDAQAMQVGAAARAVAGRMGFHADLEGAFAGDALYLLQARPITTLGTRPGT